MVYHSFLVQLNFRKHFELDLLLERIYLFFVLSRSTNRGRSKWTKLVKNRGKLVKYQIQKLGSVDSIRCLYRA